MSDHITIHPIPGASSFAGAAKIVADAAAALELREGTYKPVLYLPRDSADMRFFTPTERHTTCPWKGEASYLTLHDGDARDENAVWSYLTPKPEVAAIAGYLAFYPDKVEISRAA